jgi:hypothetical protein
MEEVQANISVEELANNKTRSFKVSSGSSSGLRLRTTKGV